MPAGQYALGASMRSRSVKSLLTALAIILPPALSAAVLALGAILILRSGAALLRCRVWPREHFRTAGLMTTIGVLVLAVFWASALYAQNLGRQMAEVVDSNPGSLLPLATVFSEKFLDLPGSHVTTTRIVTEGDGVHYRYTGLYLLTYSNDRWFLLTGRYSRQYRSSVITLHDSDQIRVEVARPASGSYSGSD